jgi:hypothetical protein
MINATENIKKALEERAHEESRPFCYGDYITVPIDEDGQAFCPNRVLKNSGVTPG